MTKEQYFEAIYKNAVKAIQHNHNIGHHTASVSGIPFEGPRRDELIQFLVKKGLSIKGFSSGSALSLPKVFLNVNFGERSET